MYHALLPVVASFIETLRDPFWQGVGIITTTVIGAISVIISILQDRPPRKFITFQRVSDAPIVGTDRRLPTRLRILLDDELVQDASLVVLKIRNSGRKLVEARDYAPPLKFNFDGREVLSSEVIETKPSGILDSQDLSVSRGSIVANQPGSIQLPPVPLNYKDSITINALLTGPHGEVETAGRILDGDIRRYSPNRGLSRRTQVLILVCALVIAVLLTATLIPRFVSTGTATPPQDCISGTVTIGGSSALYPLVKQVAQQYHQRCPGATLIVNQNANTSTAGLLGVEEGSLQIGDSDVLATSNEADLVDHPVAIVTYLVVVNQDIASSVTNLTTGQLQGIYSGRITNWKQVGGPNMPVYVVSRVSTSGTRQTFQNFILSACENVPPGARHEFDTNSLVANQVQNTPGAIGYVDEASASQLNMNALLINGQQALPTNVEKNAYKFWAIEHMYTKGLPQGLAKAFLDYMTSDSARVIVNSLHYVDYNLMSRGAIMSHQQSGISTAC